MKSIVRANGGVAVAALVIVGVLVLAAPVAAQKKTPEFTRQGLLITNFTPKGTADFGFGHDAGDDVRSRVGKLVNRREVDVISGGDIDYQLSRAGMPEDTLVSKGRPCRRCRNDE